MLEGLEQEKFVTQFEETVPPVSWRYWLTPGKFRMVGIAADIRGVETGSMTSWANFLRSTPLYYWSSNWLFSLTLHICVHNTEYILAIVYTIPPLYCESSTSKFCFFSRSELYIKYRITHSLLKFYHQLMHKRIALKGLLNFTIKQPQHVSVQPPSSGSVLFEIAKFTVVKIIN